MAVFSDQLVRNNKGVFIDINYKYAFVIQKYYTKDQLKALNCFLVNDILNTLNIPPSNKKYTILAADAINTPPPFMVSATLLKAGVNLMNYIGIDIGSSGSKLAIFNDKHELVHTLVRPTGWDSIGTAEELAKELAAEQIDVTKVPVVATGYGRNSVAYANKTVTEISCHGLGASWLFGDKRATVIDIGGQDSKIILIDQGKVRDFIMNDKCSAGTGRFLEIMANTLSVSINELCDLAVTGGGVHISSMCTVFAESEVISLIGSGTEKKDIAFAIVDSIIDRIYSQASKLIQPDEPVYLTGGLCEQQSFLEALSKRLGQPIISDPRARYAGAIGAALFASRL